VVSEQTPHLEISTDVARRLAGRSGGTIVVELRHAFPIGQGFGMSAAGAIATALAVARLVGASRERAVTTAHLADLFGGGGLGGVAAILGGGFEIRVTPGIPPFGRTVRRRVPDPVLVGIVGKPLPSSEVLQSNRALARIRRAADRFDDLRKSPTLDRFWDLSERFTDSAGLAPRELRDVLRALRRRGARAAQAMFGGSFFAKLPGKARGAELVRWMHRRGVRAVELPVASLGARLLPIRSSQQPAR
jgi:pantoate kinase